MTLTETASQLRALEADLETVPVVDSTRVEALQEAIVEGRYHVEAGDVAKMMVDFEQALHGPAE